MDNNEILQDWDILEKGWTDPGKDMISSKMTDDLHKDSSIMIQIIIVEKKVCKDPKLFGNVESNWKLENNWRTII